MKTTICQALAYLEDMIILIVLSESCGKLHTHSGFSRGPASDGGEYFILGRANGSRL